MNVEKTQQNPDQSGYGQNFHRGLVFATACLSMMLDIGFMFSFGTLYVEIMTTFNTSRSEAALIQSVLMAVRFAVGMISGAVVQKFGSVYSGIFGSLLAATGLALSYFATSVLYLEFTMGIILAFGSSCLYISSAMAVGQYYSGKARHLLISVQSAAGGVGGMIYPFLLKYLNDNFGFRGTLLIIGGIYLQILPFSLLWKRKSEPPSHTNPSDEGKNKPRNNSDKLSNSNNKFTTVKFCAENTTKMETNVENKNTIYETMTSNNDGDSNNRKTIHLVSADPFKKLGVTDTYRTETSHSTRTWDTFDDINIRIYPNKGFDEAWANVIRNDETNIDKPSSSVSVSSDGGDESNIEDCSEHEDDDEFDSKESSFSDDASVFIETLLTPSGLDSTSYRTQWENHAKYTHVRTFKKQISVVEHNKETLWQSLKYLVCNPSFAFFAVGLGIAYPALGILFIFIVDLFMDAGFSQADASFGLFLIHMFSIGGRLLPGLIMQWQRVATLSVPLIASITTAAAMAGLVYVNNLTLALILSAFIGIPYGMFVSVFSVTSLRLVGINRLSNALGVLFTVNGVGSALAGPVSGLLRDSTGSYTYPFLIAAGMVLVGGILFSIALIVRRRYIQLQIDERTPLLDN